MFPVPNSIIIIFVRSFSSSCLLHLDVWLFLLVRLAFHLNLLLCVVQLSPAKRYIFKTSSTTQMFLSLLFYISTFILHKIFSSTHKNSIRPHFITNSSTIFHCSSLQSLLLFYKFYYMLFRETVWGCAHAHCFACIVPNFWTCCIESYQQQYRWKQVKHSATPHSVALWLQIMFAYGIRNQK